MGSQSITAGSLNATISLLLRTIKMLPACRDVPGFCAQCLNLTQLLEPVSGAIFIFKNEASKTAGRAGIGEIIKKTSKKGNSHVKSMEAGTYKVVVSKQGYKNKEASINVAEGERSDLTVELEKA